MHIIVSMQADGRIVATTTQGQLLAECFFKAEDETADELRQMGYARLVHTYAAATVEAGGGREATGLGGLFVGGGGAAGGGPAPPRGGGPPPGGRPPHDH